MGDRVAVLKDGVLQQCATPRELYARPVNVFVAGFMGSPGMNLFTLPVTNGAVALGGSQIPVPREVASGNGSVVVGIRPEHFELGAQGIAMEVDVVEELGSDAFIYGRISGTDQQIVARADWRNPPVKGARVNLAADPSHVHFFAENDGRRLV